MATSSRSRQRHAGVFADQAVAMAWGAWVELGVSGWSATHRQWAIDPEPLIVLTALVQDVDRRLRDEATDWCIRNWRSVSKTRLRNLARDQSPNVREAFGEFAATVGEHIAVKWPYATEPRRFTVTGRSVAPQLDQPSMVWLRLRALFGLGARAEILRHVLVHNDNQSSIAAISAATSYTKRNVAEECETLEQAGVLRVRTVGNRFYYSLAKRTELEAFVGTMPAYRPNWAAMLNVAGQLVDLEAATVTSTSRTRAVHARKAIDAMAGDLDELRIELPGSHVAGPELWTEIQRLGAQTLGKWSLGQWHHPA